MAPSRTLPNRFNPLLVEELPEYESLVKRRRLGQTDLAPKPGQTGISSATKPKNLGTFDYAHLRVPLPKNVTSGIFPLGAPPSYFLMRRSGDGYVSATGMFKATFPWGDVKEEEYEREYIKNLATTSPDETAGNVWVPPTHALQLAAEYQITHWIRALLDNSPIEVNTSTKDGTPKAIKSPPTFISAEAESAAPSPTPVRRSRRSASPSKLPTSPRKPIATPRRSKKAATLDSSAIEAAKKNLANASTNSKKATVNGTEQEDSSSSDVVRVIVDTDVVAKGDTETTHTHVEVEMPAGSPDLPLPEDTEGMIAKAKEMVEAATKADKEASAASSSSEPAKTKKSKRKAEEFEADEDDNALILTESGPVTKRAKVESELKKEKVKTRALIGISATLAIGALIPYVFGAF